MRRRPWRIAISMNCVLVISGGFGLAPALRRVSITASQFFGSFWPVAPYEIAAMNNVEVAGPARSGGINALTSPPADISIFTISKSPLKAAYMSGVKFECVSVLSPGLPGAPASTHAPRSISNLTQATRRSIFSPPEFMPDLQTSCKAVQLRPECVWSTWTPAEKISRSASTSQRHAASAIGNSSAAIAVLTLWQLTRPMLVLESTNVNKKWTARALS